MISDLVEGIPNEATPEPVLSLLRQDLRVGEGDRAVGQPIRGVPREFTIENEFEAVEFLVLDDVGQLSRLASAPQGRRRQFIPTPAR
jgi:hypothetical protein